MVKNVAIVEDNLEVCAALRHTLTSSEGFVLRWVAHDLRQAQQHLRQPVDLILLDLGLPDGRGIELLPLLRGRRPVILAFTLFGDEASVLEAISAGVDGYVLKGAAPDDLLDAMHSALAGESPISPAVAGYLLRQLRRRESAPGPATRAELTPRERQVLETLARGYSYRDAAALLGMQPNTLAHHVKNLYPKLAANSRSEAIYRAVSQGLLRL